MGSGRPYPFNQAGKGEIQRMKDLNSSFDVVVVGGGLSGICAAVSAARHRCKVALIQDRPVLGGNASSEIRMGICGAHGKERKETGLLEEIQLNNIYYNPLMRYTIWDDVLLSFVRAESNITPLLNTSVESVETEGSRIKSVSAWNSQEYRRYTIGGTLFADCSGDGILALSGAEYRVGRESSSEFQEDFLENEVPDKKTMGNSILLQLRPCTEHHPFIPPPWAYHYDDAFFEARCAKPELRGAPQDTRGSHHSHINPYPENNNFWWIEYGGNLDTIGDAGEIAWELKKIAYGVWAYMKNHPDGRCRNFELDWIGSLPGKRESRRFVGDHLLNQHDVMSGGRFPDTVCYGGWTLDNHNPDAFLNEGFVSTHHTPPSPFGIPLRSLYSRNIENLLFAGRNISCTHMGLSACRVMATCALMGQAAGTTAALACKYRTTPREIQRGHIGEVQSILLEDDVMLPGFPRPVSSITTSAKTDYPLLQNSVDRNMDETENGVWLSCGEACVYSWEKPVKLTGCRFIFDTLLSIYDKRMRKLETLPDRKEMPPMLVREFHVDALVRGEWKTIVREKEVRCRMYRRTWDPLEVTAVRFVADDVWGAEKKAHIFTLEYR